MDYAMPIAWDQDSRGFWTKRKKSALGLVLVLSIVAGIAVAFKLFDQTIPNNVVRDAASFSFEVWKKDDLAGDPAFLNTAGCANCAPVYGPTPVFVSSKQVSPSPSPTPAAAPEPINTYPGDVRSVTVKLYNTNLPERDASFIVYATAVKVLNAQGQDVTATPQGAQFRNFWSLKVDKERVAGAQGNELNADDHGVQSGDRDNPDTYERPEGVSYQQACANQLSAFSAAAPCKLGVIGGKGAKDAAGAPRDVRYYVFNLEEVDTGADQSAFKGWTVQFSLVFSARLPAEPE